MMFTFKTAVHTAGWHLQYVFREGKFVGLLNRRLRASRVYEAMAERPDVRYDWRTFETPEDALEYLSATDTAVED